MPMFFVSFVIRVLDKLIYKDLQIMLKMKVR